MCLVALAIDASERFPFVVASNRDEFFKRPAAPLGWWTHRSGTVPVLGGRDLESGGTWLGLTAEGRLALLTNVRGVMPVDSAAPSRGAVVTDWLTGGSSTADFWTRAALSGYNGFNLVAADFLRGECFWASNTGALRRELLAGVYGLSNGGLDSPWPKVTTLKARLRASIDTALNADDLATQLFEALGDRTIANDSTLPNTGIALDRERQLSAAFIQMPDQRYGTRCSTLIIAERVGCRLVTQVIERSFDADGQAATLRRVLLPGWPPRAETRAHDRHHNDCDIATCAMPTSSNTGPAAVNPARE